MRQNVFTVGLHPGHSWGSLQRSRDPLFGSSIRDPLSAFGEGKGVVKGGRITGMKRGGREERGDGKTKEA